MEPKEETSLLLILRDETTNNEMCTPLVYTPDNFTSLTVQWCMQHKDYTMSSLYPQQLKTKQKVTQWFHPIAWTSQSACDKMC